MDGNYRFRVDVSDPDGVMYVAYLIDGKEIARDTTCCDWSEKWDSRTVANGSHVLVVRASDKLGNLFERIVPIEVDD